MKIADATTNRRRATPKQGAEEFQVTVPTFMGWYHERKIPAVVAVGRIYRFDLDEVEKALAVDAAQRQQGGTAR